MSFTQAVRAAIVKTFKWDGRAQRSEYLWFLFFTFVVYIAASILDLFLGTMTSDGETGYLSLGISLLVLLPGLAVTVRRLHDTDRSAWFLLLGLIPLVGFITLLVLAAESSKQHVNRWGGVPPQQPVGRRPRLHPAAAVLVAVAAVAGLVAAFDVQGPEIAVADVDSSGGSVGGEGDAVWIHEVGVGTCFALPDNTEQVAAVRLQDCADAHEAEVIAMRNLPDGDYPGMAYAERATNRLCAREVDELVSQLGKAHMRRVGLLQMWPSEQTWGAGDRSLICVATDHEGDAVGNLTGDMT